MLEDHEAVEGGGLSEHSRSVDARIAELESTLGKMQETIDRQDRELKSLRGLIPILPDTKLLSGKFTDRAFTIWGHYFVANLVIAVPLVCLWIAFFAVVGDF
jgi:hypothetical protein